MLCLASTMRDRIIAENNDSTHAPRRRYRLLRPLRIGTCDVTCYLLGVKPIRKRVGGDEARLCYAYGGAEVGKGGLGWWGGGGGEDRVWCFGTVGVVN